ncbi:hypothetical protein Daesc_002215 [Daldinia eschscholtzii]|uniref:Uncharacterized protein n=1 Tax=Daldinia eschscholtzii TaxID=292717 RepID=A0AAX6MWX4_9PEZI
MVIQENETPGLQHRYEGFSFFPDTELVENLTDDIKPLNGTLSNDQLQLIKDLWPKKLRRRLVPTYKSDSLGYPIECPLVHQDLVESYAWYDNWTEVLDSISKVVGIELNNTQNEKCWDEFMFDTSSRLSRLYFTVIQLFRLMTEWIEESASDIDQLKRKFREIRYEVRLGLSANEIASVEKNWDTISSKMNLLAERLYSRIHRKQEEIKSLRDGLLNATSLRDAGRATALNRAIYAFTAVTIIYTPLRFMATFWALPVLNSSSNNESAISWKAFISTFVLIPALTYIICPIAVWYFSLESSQKSLYSENIHKIQLDLRKRIRDKATAFSHKIKVSTFGRHILRPATGSDTPVEGIEFENSPQTRE